jgi:RNA recognition motif-containing protein
MYEDELYPLLTKYGELNEIRIMLENGESRGFCFAVYKKREDAQKAHGELAQMEVRGRQLRLGYSQPNTRLYVGNIPKHLGKEELHEQLSEVITGMTDCRTVCAASTVRSCV